MALDPRNYTCHKAGCGAKRRDTWNGERWIVSLTPPAPGLVVPEPPLPHTPEPPPIDIDPTAIAAPEELPARTADGSRA